MFDRPPEERSRPGEMAIACRWLREHVEVLSCFGQAKLEAVCRAFRCAAYESGGTIKSEGPDGQMYVVLAGKAIMGVSPADVNKWIAGGRLGSIVPGVTPASHLADLSTVEIAALEEAPRLL